MAKITYFGVTPEAKERIKNKTEGRAAPECDKMKEARRKAEAVTAEIKAEKAEEKKGFFNK